MPKAKEGDEKHMSKQMDINDLIPSEIKDDTRRFIDTQFQGQSAEDALPLVRNRHEGYGLLRYVPETKPTVARMKLAQEYLYRQTIA